MSIRASVFIATSLDGFIARKNGDIDWLEKANKSVPEGEDCGFVNFMNSVDSLVMGKKSYEKVLTFDEWPYGDKPVIVQSRSEMKIPDRLANSVSHSLETPRNLCERLFNKGAKRLYIDGGMTIQRFLADGLITDLTITVIPILIGTGIPLFGEIVRDISLQHISTKTYEFGFVQNTYEVIGS